MCGPCHAEAGAEAAALVFKNEPVTVFAGPARACRCGAASTRAMWWETEAHDMVSPVTYGCDEHQTPVTHRT